MPPPVHIVTRPVLQVAALELVEQGADEHRAGGADGVAEGHRAAVDVHLVPRRPVSRRNFSTTAANASFTSNRSMSSMRHAGLLQHDAWWPGPGAVSMMTGSSPATARHDDAGPGLEAVRLGVVGRGEQHGRGAVDHTRRVAAVVHVVDRRRCAGRPCSAVSSMRQVAAARASCAPIPAKLGVSLARSATVVPGRGCSSRSSARRPSSWKIGTSDAVEAALGDGRGGAVLAVDGQLVAAPRG